jgi:predicted peroxiredoxin
MSEVAGEPGVDRPRELIVKITCGAEAAERANQAWTVASMGLAAGAAVTVWLTGEAVWFAVNGRQPDLALPHAAPVVDLVEAVRSGGRIVVCSQCAARRELGPENLLSATTIAGAASFVEAALTPGVQALVY